MPVLVPSSQLTVHRNIKSVNRKPPARQRFSVGGITVNRKSLGFTLIELLIVIAILAILAAAVMVAINPGKRTAQARDAIRKQDINAIANALVAYYVSRGYYPEELHCDTSRGIFGTEGNISGWNCADQISGNNWNTTNPSPLIYQSLITIDKTLKSLPKDPLNNSIHYYRYEPSAAGGDLANDCDPPSAYGLCDRYWIGVRLEDVSNPSEQGLRVFRCSDDSSLAAGSSCKEVLFDNYSDFDAGTKPNIELK